MSRVKRFLMVLMVLAGFGSMGLSQTLPIYSYSVPQGGYDGNGNLVSYTDSVTGNWSAQYDSADRLTSVVSNAGPYGGVTLQWGYDSFGNRLSQSWTVAAGSSPSGYLPTSSWATYNARNQVVTSGPNPGGQYDASGNMVSDGQRSLLYDAEGRVCAEYTPGVGSVVQYVYDAEGVRVAKLLSSTLVCPDYTGGAVGSAGTVEATYIVGQGGEQLTEFDGTGAWKHTNVYAGGKLLATYDGAGLHFPVTDALGTVRMQVNAIGAAEESTTSLPYGDGMTTTALVPGAQDATEHHFTGKERDAESGLDYFGARYYSSSMGRFVSPDWSSEPEVLPYADLQDPQSLNLYNYSRNNPISYKDDGHNLVCTNTISQDPDGTIHVTETCHEEPNPLILAGAVAAGNEEFGPLAWAGAATLLTAGCMQTHCLQPLISLFSKPSPPTSSVAPPTSTPQTPQSPNEPDPKNLTKNVRKIAQKLGKSVREIKDAIHEIKRDMPRGGPVRNPDVLVDMETGEVYPQTPGGHGDSIGNINDHLQ